MIIRRLSRRRLWTALHVLTGGEGDRTQAELDLMAGLDELQALRNVLYNLHQSVKGWAEMPEEGKK